LKTTGGTSKSWSDRLQLGYTRRGERYGVLGGDCLRPPRIPDRRGGQGWRSSSPRAERSNGDSTGRRA